MFKILKYSSFDLLRSKWVLIYASFYFLLTMSLLWLSSDLSKVVISLMNVVLVLVPLIATMFGVMYYYNSREFIELLLAQPIRRTSIFFGQYLGAAISLSLSLIIGLGIPFVMYGVLESNTIFDFITLIVVGIFLSFIFSAFAFYVALKNENKIKGFGMAILIWLFLAIIYDGLFLLLLSVFSDYPLDDFAIIAVMFNPIDLSRILILLKLDISALMGYTGAVFQKFLGTQFGLFLAFGTLLFWVALPALGIKWIAIRKDF